MKPFRFFSGLALATLSPFVASPRLVAAEQNYSSDSLDGWQETGIQLVKPGLDGSRSALLFPAAEASLIHQLSPNRDKFTLSFLFASARPAAGQRSLSLTLRRSNRDPLINLRVSSTGSIQAFDGAEWKLLHQSAISFAEGDSLEKAGFGRPVQKLALVVDISGEKPGYELIISGPDGQGRQTSGQVSVFQNPPRRAEGVATISFQGKAEYAPYVLDAIEVR